MDIPLELSFHNMDPSDAMKDAVLEHRNVLEPEQVSLHLEERASGQKHLL